MRCLLALTHLWNFNDNANDSVGTAHASLFNGAKVQSGRLVIQNPASVPMAPLAAGTARYMERLNRGVVALNRGGGNMYVGWRMLGTDPAGIGFNLYRSVNGGAFSKRNASVLTQTTDYLDNGITSGSAYRYYVRPVISGVEQEPSDTFTVAGASSASDYLSIPLQIPAGGTTPSGEAYTYSANDASVGDVDGDGDYEYIVKWDPSNSKDNSQSGYTGNVYVDAYTLQGTLLWRIDLGRNIRAGAHYTQFQVYDLDSDGKAEIAMKTAPGTIDGAGNPVLRGSATVNDDYRNASGYILSGPEYLTIFNGATGAAMATVDYVVARGTVSSWGDSYGNRVDRFLAGVAYLDGERPSLIMARGYYTRATITAWDWRNGQLTQRWLFDSNVSGSQYRGQGNHNLSIADADGDGKDEIIYGAMAVNDNGAPLHTTGWGHGDALHVSDFDPDRPGLEVWDIHEPGYPNIGASFRDANTGAAIFTLAQSSTSTEGPGRAVAADIWAGNRGAEMWVAGGGVPSGAYDRYGNIVGDQPSSVNFLVWWDADVSRELLNSNVIVKYNPTGSDTTLLTAGGATSNNTTKSTPALSADVLGDWREEVLWRSTDSSQLRIYTTPIAATSRMYTLMHDSQYRVAVSWQNTAYNQPPHPSFYLGDGTATAPVPNIVYPALPGPTSYTDTYQAELHGIGGGSIIESTNGGFNGSAYINFPTTGGFLQYNNVDGGATGGLTTIRFRYALGAASARTGTLSINGAAAQNITFNPTGAWTNWTELELQVPLNPGTTNTIQLQSTGQDLANQDELQVVIVDTTPPAFTGGEHLFDAAPDRLDLSFSEDVSASFSLADVVIERLGDATTITPTAFSFAGNMLSLTLPASIPDGNYRLTFASAGITDRIGLSLTGSNTFNFFVLNADANRDRAVNTADFNLLAASFGLSGKLFSGGDFDGNGIVNSLDFAIYAAQYGKTLPAPLTGAAVFSGSSLFGDQMVEEESDDLL